MNKYDLSVLIPARNEMFVAETVKNILANIRGKTEVIVVLDGAWADPQIEDAPNLTIIYFPEAIGQRAAANQACRLSQAKYVMKIDAHCVVDEGFDIKLMADMQDNYTMIPTLYNLHGFDWVCIGQHKRSGKKYETKEWFIDKPGCGNRKYQAPTDPCEKCNGNMERELVFKPRFNKRSFYYRFDTTLHFQYWGSYEDRVKDAGQIVDIMSTQGSCFMLTREKYWELKISDENAAGKSGWGQQGVEVACKTWLSGGRLVTNKNTWYSHMFRTQGRDFGFPYPLSANDVEKARQISRGLWLENTWDKQIYPLSWMLDKFGPVPGWHYDFDRRWTPQQIEEAQRVMEEVKRKGEEWYKTHPVVIDEIKLGTGFKIDKMFLKPTKGIIFYTDNLLKLKFAHKVQDQLRKADLPITSASLKSMSHFGDNIHIHMQRGMEAYFTQVIAALERSKADIVYMCEADVIYHPSHFDFIPERRDMFYYNQNFWRIRPEKDNLAVHWDANQVSGLVGYREYILDWYKKKWEQIQQTGFDRSYEPGGRDANQYIAWKAAYPNIDIRHGGNLTKSKWRLADFRDKSTATGFSESTLEQIPGWDLNFLLSLR